MQCVATRPHARDSGADILRGFKEGGVNLAIAGSVEDGWDRLDRWPLFSEGFELQMHMDHPLARMNSVDVASLNGQPLLKQTGCEDRPAVKRWFEDAGAALTDRKS